MISVASQAGVSFMMPVRQAEPWDGLDSFRDWPIPTSGADVHLCARDGLRRCVLLVERPDEISKMRKRILFQVGRENVPSREGNPHFFFMQDSVPPWRDTCVRETLESDGSR